MTQAEQNLARLTRRLADVTSGHAKLSALLKGRPNDHRAEGWKRRISEYEDSMAGLPVAIKAAQAKVARQKP
jgi:hypothetical protein